MKGGGCFMNSNMIKLIGTAVSIIGVGANLVSSYISDKKTEAMIGAKVAEAISKMNTKS